MAKKIDKEILAGNTALVIGAILGLYFSRTKNNRAAGVMSVALGTAVACFFSERWYANRLKSLLNRSINLSDDLATLYIIS